jgi:Na+/H+-dicarboxylate symporter
MELQNKNLEAFLARAENDPAVMELLRNLIRICQEASEMGIPLAEIAAAGTVGWTIGQDPKLQAMIEYLFEISKIKQITEH